MMREKDLESKMKINRNTRRRQGPILMAYLVAGLLFVLARIGGAECHLDGMPSISQFSPKSSSHAAFDADADTFTSTARAALQSTIEEDSAAIDSAIMMMRSHVRAHEENETRRHVRVERSASPILNDQAGTKASSAGANKVHFSGGVAKDAPAGRYFEYNIKPTSTYDDEDHPSLPPTERPESTAQRSRAGKTLNDDGGAALSSASSSFLLRGDLRPFTSGSPSKITDIQPTTSSRRSSATSAAAAAASATAMPHLNNGRQNANPDIQDIITGIVKLLNGNVNVHANTQGVRRPTASRINNRGPPRISDVPPLPLDYETPQKKPPHGNGANRPNFAYDLPERPYITGVPIPEQIVPYRPGFVSNRPPWHRQKPRPPITTAIGGRRPIPQYKPLPPSQMSPPREQESLPDDGSPPSSADYPQDNQDTPKPTDTAYDSDFSSEDTNAQYIEVSDQESENFGTGTGSGSGSITGSSGSAVDLDDDLQPPPPAPTQPAKKDEKKKQSQKQKTGVKRKPSSAVTSSPLSGGYTTIIETSSVVHTVMRVPSSTYMPMPMDDGHEGIVDLESSDTEEVIFMTPSRTPTLDSTTRDVTTAEPSKTFTAKSSLTTAPLEERGTQELTSSSGSIDPTPSTSAPYTPSTTSTSIATTTTVTDLSISTTTTSATSVSATDSASSIPSPATSGQYHPRPGIVLDDPEFKPGGRPRPQRPSQPQPQPALPPPHIQPTRQHLPPGYGEIFDVTLSAIQGPGTAGGSQQTINIKPYGAYNSGGGVAVGGGGVQQGDIIVSAADPPTGVQQPTTPATAIPRLPGGGGSSGGGSNGVGGSGNGGGAGGGEGSISQNSLSPLGPGYGVPQTEIVDLKTTKPQSQPQAPPKNVSPTRPHYRSRPTQPPVRIDTCIVGDDSTCDQAQHERCKTENGVSSCHCRPGYSRRKHREPCRKVITFFLGMRVDRIYEHRIVWDQKLLDRNSEPYGQLSYESIRALDSAMSMTPYSDEFMHARVNNIYRGDPNLGGSGVFVNVTISLDESVETLRPNLRSDVQKHLLGVLQRRNNNIGNSVLYVSSPEGAISALHDLDECESRDLNDCHESASCTNSWGTFRCSCESGYRDPWADQPARAGRDCQSCPDSYCNNRGSCSYNDDGAQVCACDASHYGSQCEIDGEVLGVAIGASVAAVIIIVLTLVCLIMWSRRWQREQKNAMGSPVFGYMNTAPLKSAGLPQAAYQVTLEDRMRWAQIADVMAQTNHYGAEPIGPTRPSSAMFGYPNLQAMGIGTLGGMSMQSTLQMHQNASMAPPVPLPRRLGISSRSNGMRTLENSSSSEEEDRTDLLGRNFQVPRPKSRSNGSIANQSGIYYDVDYEPSGNGIGNTSVDHLYGSQNHSTASHSHLHPHSHSHSHSHSLSGNQHIPGPQGIPMSTYTSGRAPSSYYMK